MNHWTQKQLAEAVHVDQSAISRLLSRNKSESEDLARRVITVLNDQLSLSWPELSTLAEAYALSPEQREEKSHHQKVIGVIIPSLETNHYWGQLMSAVDKLTAPDGGNLVVAQHNNSLAHFLEDLASFKNIDVIAGIICVPPYGTAKSTRSQISSIQTIIDTIHGRGIPVIFLERYILGLGSLSESATKSIKRVPYVGVDRARMVELAIQNLRAHGHTRIGALVDLPWASAEAEFVDAYVKTMGNDYEKELLRLGSTTSNNHQEHGSDPRKRNENAQALLDPHFGPRPTAIVCSTQLGTHAALEAANKLGLAVPQDVSIVGIDPVSYHPTMEPETCRISYDISSYVKTAYDHMWELINSEKEHEAISRKKIPAFPKPIIFKDIKLIRRDLIGQPKESQLGIG